MARCTGYKLICHTDGIVRDGKPVQQQKHLGAGVGSALFPYTNASA